MSKRLSERVLERLKTRSKRSRLHNKAVFSALLGDIQEAINEGCSLKAIWETLHEEGKINFKYDAFLRYARELVDELKKSDDRQKTDKNLMNNPKPKKPEEPTSKRIVKSSPISSFEFSPTRNMDEFK